MGKLEGITVNGIPLSVETADDLDTEKTNEIEIERRETIKAIPPKKHKSLKNNKTKSHVQGHIKHLTDNQIRKEYGLMERPFNTNTENILWAMMNVTTPSTPKEIAEIAGYEGSDGSLSSIISSIYYALYPGGFVTREIYGKSKKYLPGTSKDIEYLYAIVRRYITVKTNIRNAKAKETLLSEDLAPPVPPKTSSPLDMMAIIKSAMEKALGIKVEVSGYVNIVIKTG